ncbi:MAG TPA: MotA/TolQ/ExbB proton channel family protein [Polyangia bacterium]
MILVESLKSFFLNSGAAWVLWFLLGLAAASIAVAVERALFFRGRTGNLATLAAALEDRLSNRDIGGARKLLAESPSAAAAVADAGLRVARRGPAAADRAMQGACALERDRLERRLAFLGTLGNNAPFVGLFGTVVGVIQAFEQLGVGAQASGGGGQAASQAVMAGIAEALVATAVGIGVALPAVALYNYFQRRISALLSGTEAVTAVVMAHLLAEAPDAGASSDVAGGPSGGGLLPGEAHTRRRSSETPAPTSGLVAPLAREA